MAMDEHTSFLGLLHHHHLDPQVDVCISGGRTNLSATMCVVVVSHAIFMRDGCRNVIGAPEVEEYLVVVCLAARVHKQLVVDVLTDHSL